MSDTSYSVVKRRKPGVDKSPDRCHYVLNKQLDVCGKCNRKCLEDDDAVQYVACGYSTTSII